MVYLRVHLAVSILFTLCIAVIIIWSIIKLYGTRTIPWDKKAPLTFLLLTILMGTSTITVINVNRIIDLIHQQ